MRLIRCLSIFIGLFKRSSINQIAIVPTCRQHYLHLQINPLHPHPLLPHTTYTNDAPCPPFPINNNPYSTHHAKLSCFGWGQFIGVTPLELREDRPVPPTRRYGVRYSPYSVVWRRQPMICSVRNSMGEEDGGLGCEGVGEFSAD